MHELDVYLLWEAFDALILLYTMEDQEELEQLAELLMVFLRKVMDALWWLLFGAFYYWFFAKEDDRRRVYLLGKATVIVLLDISCGNYCGTFLNMLIHLLLPMEPFSTFRALV